MKRLVAALLAFLAIAALDVARAETATALVAADPQSQYRNIKSVVGTAIRTNKVSLLEDHQARTIDLHYCSSYFDIAKPIGKQDRLLSKLLSVAYDTEIFEAGLRSAGYPATVWRDALAARERQGLLGNGPGPRASTDANDVALKRFASVLNDYRAQGHDDLPTAIVEGGCGAGGTMASFRTDPPGGRILLVPKMFYALCKAQGIDPADETQCDFWHEVFSGQRPEVSGDYFAKLVWTDHSVLRTFSASKLEEGSNNVTLK